MFRSIMVWCTIFALFSVLLGACAPKQAAMSPTPDDRTAAQTRSLTVAQVEQLHTTRGLTNEEIMVMPQAKLDRALRKAASPKPEHPDKYLLWRLDSLKNEKGVIPPDAWSSALQHVRRMDRPAGRAIWGGPEKVEDKARVAGLQSDQWTWLGPGNIGGRLRSMIIHPTQTDTMWVGSVSGGIWKTTDGGASWSAVNDFMANLAVTTMVMDPTNTSVMYAGTGEGFYNFDAIRGAGIFKSTDGGVTWNQLASTNNADFYFVNRLAMSVDGATLYAATNEGLFVSTNGGGSWLKELSGIRFQDVDAHPTESNKAIFGAVNGYAGYTDDSGNTWNFGQVTTPAGRVEVAYAPSDPDVVYASVDINSGAVYRSVDGGASWSLRSTGDSYLGSQGWYDNIIWVDPLDKEHVIVGGIDLWRSTAGTGNGTDSSLNKISVWWMAPDQSAHADHHFIMAHPDYDGTTNTTVFFCNDGGIYKTDDVTTVGQTTGWQNLNNNLGVTQFYGAAASPDGSLVVGGTQDNGHLGRTNTTGEDWYPIEGGDGGFCAVDFDNPSISYGEYVYGRVHRSTTSQEMTADSICGEYWNGAWVWKNPPYRIEDAYNNTAEFIAPFIMDPNNAQRLLVGGESLWRTNDARTANTNTTGPTWEEIAIPIGSNIDITAIAVATGNPDRIIVGYDNGAIYKTEDGTAASPVWSPLTSPSPRRCTRLVIDPHDSTRFYAAFGGFSPDNLYMSDDSGTTWDDITGSGDTGLPEAPIRAIAVHPDNSKWIYAGTEVGVFGSEDRGQTWSTTNEGPTNCSVDELLWTKTDTLIAATHGRGLFEIDIPAQQDATQSITPIYPLLLQ